jgi:hypothetical protein
MLQFDEVQYFRALTQNDAQPDTTLDLSKACKHVSLAVGFLPRRPGFHLR